jgi:hypothetical protein
MMLAGLNRCRNIAIALTTAVGSLWVLEVRSNSLRAFALANFVATIHPHLYFFTPW